jgi:ubiquinone/menaquinone biosynthesis C-methylase UbiE
MPFDYIHSYDGAEQNRLLEQAAFLEPYIHPLLSFEPGDSILEIGCGVGAQIRTILKRQKLSSITGVDFSRRQINKARQLLATEVEQGVVRLLVGDGAMLPFADESFDAIYVFFVLEHFSNPGAILAEARRVLRPAGRMYCTEVFNSGIYIYPHSEILTSYWRQFNKLQADFGGNPDIGIHLPSAFLDAGFKVSSYTQANPMLDKRMQDPMERKRFMAMWEALFLSGAEKLINKDKVPREITGEVSSEFQKLREYPDAIFEYGLRQIVAHKLRESSVSIVQNA